ncbi:hypothetical protein GCM10011534_12220 [Pseudooceanicola nanhaiensis]|jgi:hypothetical protein|uniref:3',5'-cyclic-nucleotide phosphodiesterase n=1 Tax=Pseudooceanicola nanhaiensis TaxID=375761 RepID=A0A917WD45_9RHOB|nr:hypothetical protein [Pseudooceanicola nanhaiensis]GGL91598.1 hypothetical protein GCM10011534_12220 [Pseudooceanicola nanhaiensis]
MKFVAIVAALAAAPAAASEEAQEPGDRTCTASGLTVMFAVEMAKKYQEFCHDTSLSRTERDAACAAFVDTVEAMKPAAEWVKENCPAE